jgi:hypothetical protein
MGKNGEKLVVSVLFAFPSQPNTVGSHTNVGLLAMLSKRRSRRVIWVNLEVGILALSWEAKSREKK